MGRKRVALNKLSADDQQKVVDIVNACDGNVRKAVGLIRDKLHIGTSASSVARFCKWWHLQRALEEQNFAFKDELKKVLTSDAQFGLTSAQAEAAMEKVFILSAARSGDFELFKELRKLRQKDEQIEIEREKQRRDTVEFALKLLEDAVAMEIARTEDSNAEKIDRLGRHMFGEDWK